MNYMIKRFILSKEDCQSLNEGFTLEDAWEPFAVSSMDIVDEAEDPDIIEIVPVVWARKPLDLPWDVNNDIISKEKIRITGGKN